LTPEVTNLITLNHNKRIALATTEEGDIFLKEARRICLKYSVWILIGSLVIKDLGNSKCANRSFLINPHGSVISKYDKIHMFDISLSENETYKESDYYNHGNVAKLVNTDIGNIGMSICYDLRFPVLFNQMAANGADILVVPAAFTYTTGRKHWEILLRARAIENGCFVLAPAQCGSHDPESKRVSYGHSMIISPWGEVMTKLSDAPGICTHDIDINECAVYREKIPNIKNIRKYSLKRINEMNNSHT
jgi:predicted amidohydrolase